MDKKKVKVYTYTRVSTTMQIDGYSLDAQKSRMKAFAEYNDYEIVREYEDAGKSGKSIEGRVQFSQMMDDIKEGKDGVSYVLVFKLSRFGRNAADVLSTLQIMQDFGVNLICVEDGIDSSKDAGKLMISVLSAVAEIERENIRVQTMEGRIQKAREGKWNGGFAPYGYQLVDGKLEINEEEAVAIRVIFDQYVNTNIGSNGIAKYLENHGIRKIQRQNGKNPLFDAHLVRLILRNPVYCGKIAYGRRRTEKVHGTRNDYHLVEQENYLLVDGLHEAIVSEEIWQAAQVKLLAQAKKYEHVNKGKDTRTHLLSGIVKCPVCGAGMYGNKCIKHKKDGTKYVLLDMRPVGEKTLREHFPTICAHCRECGYDVLREPIPVVPAQHYFMGGIKVDLDGRTSMRRLFAAGETACNGVHGKNRLASNSLLESLIWAERAAKAMAAKRHSRIAEFPAFDAKKYENYAKLKQNYAKIVR